MVGCQKWATLTRRRIGCCEINLHRVSPLEHEVYFFTLTFKKIMSLSRFKKWLFWVIGTLIVLFVAMGMLLSWQLPDFMKSSRAEVARVVSPNGKIDAVLIETNGGVTTSFGYEVHVLQHGTQVLASPAAYLYGAVRSRSADGANLKWEAADLLTVEFLTAKTKDLSKPSVSVAGEAVRLSLREGIADFSAPPGGMFYNLRKKQ